MRITGYKLQHTLRELHHRRDMAARQFDDSLFQFEDESKPTPEAAMKVYSDTEAQIAKLQTAQGRYNLGLTVEVLGESMTLAEAVKRVGGAGRMEKMWRSIAAPKKDCYGYDRDLTRSADEVRAKRVMEYGAAGDLAQKASRFASALREAIQVANVTEVEMDELTPALFE